MPLPSFTISQDTKIYDILGDVVGSQLSQRWLTNAKVLFRCNVSSDDFVLWEEQFNRVHAVEAYVNTAGAIERDYQPVKLLANDSGLNVTGIQWTIDVRVGDEVVKSWTFNAPGAGEVLDLATVAPVPSTSANGVTRGPRGYGITGTFLGKVANQAAMLAKTGAIGDWVARLDTGSLWVVTALPLATVGNWLELDYPSVDFLDADHIIDAGTVGKAVVRAASQGAAWTALGMVPSGNLPSYVDDVLEVANFASLPGTGETGKIYVTLDTNHTYRWSGSAYVDLGSDVTAALSAKVTRPTAAAALTTSTTPTADVTTRYDATAGSLTPTLPPLSGLSVGTQFPVEKSDASTNTVTLTAAGSDTFLSGGTTKVLRVKEKRTLQVVSLAGTKYWDTVWGDTPLSSLDGRYVGGGSQTLDARSYGASLNGTTDDTTALNAAIAAANSGSIKHILVTGTALVSAPLTALGTGVILEFRNGGIKVSSGYTSSTPVITLSGAFTEIRGNMQVSGGSTVAATMIYVAPTAIGSHIDGVNTNQFTGGWLVEAECGVNGGGGGVSNAPNGFTLKSVRAQNVNYGVYVHGHPGVSNNDLQGFLTNLNIQSCTHDCLRIVDVSDVQVSMVDLATTGTTSGAADIHVIGACSSIIVDNMDIGIYPATLSTVTQPVIWIESNGNGAPLNVQFIGGIVQAGNNNVLVDAGDALVFRGLRSQACKGSAMKVTATTSTRVLIDQCQFVNSNASGGTCADVEVTSSATVRIRRGEHYTANGTATANAVPNSYIVPASNNVTVDGAELFGTGVTLTNAFSNPVAGSITLAMTRDPTITPLRVRGAASQTANIFQVENYLAGQLFAVTQNGQMSAPKGAYRGVTAKTGTYGLTALTDDVIVFTITNPQTATLPSASAVGGGRVFTIINATASTATLTLAATAGTVPISSFAANTAVTVVSDGTNWQRIA